MQKVILVGGLASSPYVYQELQSWGTRMGISVSRPDGPTYVVPYRLHFTLAYFYPARKPWRTGPWPGTWITLSQLVSTNIITVLKLPYRGSLRIPKSTHDRGSQMPRVWPRSMERGALSSPRYISTPSMIHIIQSSDSGKLQDIRISAGDEYKQPYVFKLPATSTNLIKSCDLWVYRWDQPSRFMMLPSMTSSCLQSSMYLTLFGSETTALPWI
jgi:hypothetical protein